MLLATTHSVGTAFTVGNWSIQWYGIIMALALLAGLGIAMAMFRRAGKTVDDVLDLALIVVPLALVGARAHYVIFSWHEFANRPFWHVFAVWEGGMAIFGAVLAGMLGLWIYARWKKFSFYELADAIVPALALGQAIGRWGNFANQEVYGFAVKDPALHWFPMSVYIEATGTYHYALFFYECLFNLALFALLFFVLSRRSLRKGMCFWIYLLGYGLCRAIMEGFREEAYIQRTAGLPMNQIVAVVLAVLAAAVLIRWAYQAWRARQVHELSDDLVVLSSRGKVKVDADGNVIRVKEEDEAAQAAEEPAADKPAEEPALRFLRVEKDTELAEQLIRFVEDFSWAEVREHTLKTLRQWEFTDWECMFAAMAGDEIVGMASIAKADYYPLPDIYPWISCIFVTEKWRGRRISGQLIAFAEDYARELGFTAAYIPSEHTGLYEKYGYRFLREIENYGGGVDRLYTKEL